MDGWDAPRCSWRDRGGRRCRAEAQRVTQPDTPPPTVSPAPGGGAVDPSLGTPQQKAAQHDHVRKVRLTYVCDAAERGREAATHCPWASRRPLIFSGGRPIASAHKRLPSALPRAPHAPHTFVMSSHRVPLSDSKNHKLSEMNYTKKKDSKYSPAEACGMDGLDAPRARGVTGGDADVARRRSG